MTHTHFVGLAVMKDPCDQCLYSRNRIVRRARFRQILSDITERDSFFVCHKASIEGVTAACRGDWDNRGCGQAGQIASRLGMLKFVEQAELAGLPPAPEPPDDEDTPDTGDEIA
jgi:hypothetical protein